MKNNKKNDRKDTNAILFAAQWKLALAAALVDRHQPVTQQSGCGQTRPSLARYLAKWTRTVTSQLPSKVDMVQQPTKISDFRFRFPCPISIRTPHFHLYAGCRLDEEVRLSRYLDNYLIINLKFFDEIQPTQKTQNIKNKITTTHPMRGFQNFGPVDEVQLVQIPIQCHNSVAKIPI